MLRIQTSKKGLKIMFNRGLILCLIIVVVSESTMVKRCAWGTCKTDSRYPERLIKGGKVINFHPFPSEKKFKECRELWIRSCSRSDDFKCTKDSYICSLHFVGENGPTDKDPNPVPATASREKVCYLCVYCMSTYYFYSVI